MADAMHLAMTRSEGVSVLHELFSSLATAGDFFVCNRDLFCYSGDRFTSEGLWSNYRLRL